jgi:hypothetical protein
MKDSKKNFNTEEKMKQQLINEHDITKMMLNKINESKLVKEQESDNTQMSDNTLTGSELKAQEDKFVQVVSPRVTFNELKVYPDDNNVFWSGEFDNGMSWQMSKNDELVIDAENVTIDDEELELINKLKKYREVWVDEWSEKLRTEYNKTT